MSGRQARWIEKIGEFDFEVVYVPGVENVLADSLSWIYSNDAAGTVRAPSEYTYHDVVNEDPRINHSITMPVLAGVEAVAVSSRPCVKKVVPPAESGRPETSKEFAARIKGSFILKGPQSRVEGVSPLKGPVIKLPARTVDGKIAKSVPEPSNSHTKGLPDADASLLGVVSGDGIDLPTLLRNKYSDDSFFRGILDKPKHYHNFEPDDGLIFVKINDHRLLCIPRIYVKGCNICEIVIAEGHSLLAHLGASKTLAYLRDHVWWKEMALDVKTYCETCMTCRLSKPLNQKPYGLLNPLDVPGQPWESIGIDFVGPLPESKNHDGLFDSITVIICLLTGMVHLIPSRINYNARQVAELVFEGVYKLHGLPKSIVSDRDVLFTSVFWQNLHKLIGTKLKL